MQVAHHAQRRAGGIGGDEFALAVCYWEPADLLMEIADRARERSRNNGGNCVELCGGRHLPPTQS